VRIIEHSLKTFFFSLLTYLAEAAAFNTAMTTWRAQRDEAWKKYAGLM
jgi:hypothetical protein